MLQIYLTQFIGHLLFTHFWSFPLILHQFGDIIGRRFSAVVSLGSFSIMMLICIPVIDNTLLVTIFGMIGRFFIIYSMNTALQLRLLEALALQQYRGSRTSTVSTSMISTSTNLQKVHHKVAISKFVLVELTGYRTI